MSTPVHVRFYRAQFKIRDPIGHDVLQIITIYKNIHGGFEAYYLKGLQRVFMRGFSG